MTLRQPLLLRCGAALVFLTLGFAYGLVAGHYHLFPYNELRNVAIRLSSSNGTATAADPPSLDLATIQQLGALGYLQGYRPAVGRSGVVTFDETKAQPGLNVYVSAAAPRARLVEMDGSVLHEWYRPYRDACPTKFVPPNVSDFWRRVLLLPDGGLLAISDFQGLLRLDAESRIVWSRCEAYHHDLTLDDENRIWILRRDRRLSPAIDDRLPFWDDSIEVLNEDGSFLRRISIVEALLRSRYAPHLLRIDRSQLIEDGDILHSNSLKWLDGTHEGENPAFRKGNVLVSVRQLDLVAVIDTNLEEVTWAISGMWARQHEPVLLSSGRMLLFDNLGRAGHSRVVEFDPRTQQVAWSYPGNDEGDDLTSRIGGSVQRLANGNTLITESEAGRVLEVTPDHEVVWRFINPDRVVSHRGGSPSNPLVAAIYDMKRLDFEQVQGWLVRERQAGLAELPEQR